LSKRAQKEPLEASTNLFSHLLPRNEDQNLPPCILKKLELQDVLQWNVAASYSSARGGRRGAGGIYRKNSTCGLLKKPSV